MAGPWEKYAAPTAPAAGPWTRYAAPAAAEPEQQPVPAATEPTSVYRGSILPFERMSDGTRRLAVPGIISDTIDSLRLPEKVASGAIDPMSDEAFEQQLGLAGLVVGGGMPKPGVQLMNAGKAVPDAVASALRADGVPLGEVASRVRDLGPAGVVADLGPNARYKAAALATLPGEAQTTVVKTMRDRQIAAPGRVTGALDETLGPAKVPDYLQADIKANMQALGPEYDKALAGGSVVDTTDLATTFDTEAARLRGSAQSQLKSVRGMLNKVEDPDAPPPLEGVKREPELESDPDVLHQTRQAIDGMIRSETDTNVKRVLTDARAQIDEVLGAAVPDIKPIDSKYAELGNQGRAVERGQTVLDNGREAPRPQVLADEVAAGAVPKGDVVGPSGVAFRLSQGARAEIDRLVGTKLNDRAALNGLLKGESDWNYQRLSTLFGPEKVDRLYKVLDNERAMAETENLAISGSRTQGLKAAQDEIAGPDTKKKGAVTSAMNLDFGDAARKVLDKATGGYSTYRRDSINKDIADALMGQGDLSVTSRTGASKTSGILGALVDTIMQSAPAPANKQPMSEEEYRQAILQGLGA